MSIRSKLRHTYLLALIASSAASRSAWAEPGLSYSGRLVTSDGKPVLGPADLVVKFFDQETGGNPLIGERTLTSVPLDDGMFEVELHLSQSDLNTVLGNGSTSVYIEISYGQTTYPRQKFAAVPYALRVPIDQTSIVQDEQGRLTVGAITASKISDLTTATAGFLGGTAFDQTNPAPGKVIKWNGSKYYLDIDNTSGAAGAITATTLTTSAQAALTIAPHGTAAGETGELRFGELAAHGGNYVALKAPDTLAANLVWTLPTRIGTSGELLTTNGAGELAWSAISGTQILEATITDNKLTTITTPGKVSGAAIVSGTLGGSAAFHGSGGIDTPGPITGAGNITLKGRTSASSELRFADNDSSHYLAFKAPATVNESRVWTLPLSDGAQGAALTTDGNGNLSWASPEISGPASILTSKLSGPVTAVANHGLGTLSLQNTVNGAQIDDFTIFDADIASSAGIAGSKISFADDAISGNKIQGGVISDFASVGIDDNASSLAMTINAGGNVGIGTTDPTARFHLVNSSTVVQSLGDGLLISNNNGRGRLTISGANQPLAVNAEVNLDRSANNRGGGMRIQSSGDSALQWWAGVPYSAGSSSDKFQIGRDASMPEYDANALVTVNSAGNVGIGTTTPSAKLHVSGTAGTDGIMFPDGSLQKTAAIGSGSSQWTTSGSNIYFNTGSVGIGTNNPASIFHVQTGNVIGQSYSGPGGIGLNITSADGGGAFFSYDINHSIFFRKGQDGALDTTSFYQYGGTLSQGRGHRFFTGGAIQSQTLKLLIADDGIFMPGKVGIGTTVPGLPLNVKGPSGFPAASGSTQTGSLRLEAADNGVLDFGVGNGGSGAWLQSTDKVLLSTSYNLLLQPNGGNLGIGTTSPASKLSVSGGASLGSYSGNTAPTNGLIVSGNVGIGTTAPASKLSVNGGASFGTYSGNAAPSNGLIISGNVGIGTITPSSLLSVGAGSQFQVDASGNPVKINNIAYSWPAAQGATSTVLTNDGSGTLTWASAGGDSGLTSCPTGFTMVGTSGRRGTFCIDSDERTGQAWLAAKDTCRGLDHAQGRAFMCSHNEWYTACRDAPSGLINMTNGWEWVAEFERHTNNDAVLAGSGGCSGLNNDILTNTYVFRCCVR